MSPKTDVWTTLSDDDAKEKEFYIPKSFTRNFKEALEFCNNVGGLLFEPRDAGTTEILYNHMENKKIESYWIGIHDHPNENFVYNSDNSPIAWDNWSNMYIIQIEIRVRFASTARLAEF